MAEIYLTYRNAQCIYQGKDRVKAIEIAKAQETYHRVYVMVAHGAKGDFKRRIIWPKVFQKPLF